MFIFRKSSLSWKQQMSKMFQNEKKVRKNGNVEQATFDFYPPGAIHEYQSDVEMEEEETRNRGSAASVTSEVIPG